MAEADPADVRRVEHRSHGVAYRREEFLWTGVVKQRVVVQDEELVELKIDFWHIGRNPVEAWGNLSNLGQDVPSFL